jgi:hypothetical protein
VQIKVLYGILVLSFAALVGVALASYIRVRSHMKKAKPGEHEEFSKDSEERNHANSGPGS